jgi:hypothetical protein
LPGAVYRTNAAHNAIANGCVTCHMADLPDNTVAGGHSFAINYTSGSAVRINSSGCREGCHINWTGSSADQIATADVDSAQAAFEEHLAELGDALFARGWLNSARELVVPANAPTNANDRGVLWNYLLLHSDLSEGVHNPRYAEDIIDASLAYLAESANR